MSDSEQDPRLRLFPPQPPRTPTTLAPIRVTPSGRSLQPTAAFASYWHLAAERQNMLFRRLRGDTILTHDPILRDHRFTNAYRAADRVSQYVISTIANAARTDENDLVFRTLLFKIFNKIETWNNLEERLGEPICWDTFSLSRYTKTLNDMLADKQAIYSNAYMMPMPNLGFRFKHENHLALLEQLICNGLAARIASARSLAEVYDLLAAIPSFGPFLAFQYTIDLNYTPLLDFNENDFVVAGPGAIDGIRKCFLETADYSNADVIRIMADIALEQFEQRDIAFLSLWGRPLHLIDCQNLFCETDKYARVAHPDIAGESGRTRIKQRYTPARLSLPPYTFPTRWNLSLIKPIRQPSKLKYS